MHVGFEAEENSNYIHDKNNSDCLQILETNGSSEIEREY